MKNLTILKFEPATPNTSKHVTTPRYSRVAKCTQHVAPNSVAICCVEMLPSFGWGLKALQVRLGSVQVCQSIDAKSALCSKNCHKLINGANMLLGYEKRIKIC